MNWQDRLERSYVANFVCAFFVIFVLPYLFTAFVQGVRG